MTAILSRTLSAVSTLLLLAGAALVLAGVFSPWATFRVFHNIEINLPGLVFAGGGLCLSVAALVFLGARRSPLLCLVGAILVFSWVGEAEKKVPERVKFQLAGSQLEFQASINRLLDQFHIPDIEVADLNTPNPQLLGTGLDETRNGAKLLLLGGLLGLPIDPVAVWVWARTARARCRLCGARWLLGRHARFCPRCGAPALPPGQRACPACHALARRGDHHCTACGQDLPLPGIIRSGGF